MNRDKKTKDNKKEKNSNRLKLAVSAIQIFLSFVSSGAFLAGKPTTLGLAVIASAESNCGLCYVSAVLGMLLFGTLEKRIVNAAAMTLFIALRSLMVMTGVYEKNKSAVSVACTSVSILVSLAITGYYFSLSADDIVYYLISAAVCGLLVYFIMSAEKRASADGLLDLNGVNGASLAVIYVALISLLTSLEAFGLNLGRIIGAIILLCAATKFRHIGGAVCGALTTCGAVLCSVDSAGNTLLLATAGLLCGAVSSAGSFAMILCFLISSVTGLAVIGFNPDSINMLKDVALASVLFCCIPNDTVTKLLRYVGGDANAVSIVGQAASSRLSYASKTLGGIRTQLDEITDVINRKSDTSDLQTDASNMICLECASCHLCWSERTADTYRAFTHVENKIGNTGSVDNYDIRSCLPECSRAAELSGAFNLLYQNRLYNYSNRIRIGELKETVSQQLSAMEEILSDLSLRISQISSVDPSLSEKIRTAAIKCGCTNAKACVSCDNSSDSGSIRAELFVTNQCGIDLVRLTIAVSEILGVDMGLPSETTSDGITKLIFMPLPEYEISVGIWQSSAEQDVYSGDTVECVKTNACEEYVMVADGMGTGKRAKLDSMFVLSLAERLYKTGISCSTSVRMINSVMRVKGWEESFSTMDIARFDLRRGYCEFIKAGAAPSFLVRDEAIGTVSFESLPLGILPETDLSSERVKLFHGDIIILASDGIGISPERILLDAVCDCSDKDADFIASEIGSRFKRKTATEIRDDISICVVKVSSVDIS